MEEEVKVVLVGAQGVGKTSLVLRWVEGKFESQSSTIGAAFFTQKLTVKGKRLKMQVWDTAGQERFRSMAPMYYRGSRAACIVFDVSFRPSFEDLITWIKELRQNVGPEILLFIVGNKIESRSEESVTLEEASAFAKNNHALYFETSAKAGKGVSEMFVAVAEQLAVQPAPTYLKTQPTPSLPGGAQGSKCCES